MASAKQEDQGQEEPREDPGECECGVEQSFLQSIALPPVHSTMLYIIHDIFELSVF